MTFCADVIEAPVANFCEYPIGANCRARSGPFCLFACLEFNAVPLFVQNALKSLIPNTAAFGTYPVEAS